MITRTFRFLPAAVAVLASATACAQDTGTNDPWQAEFGITMFLVQGVPFLDIKFNFFQ